MVAGIRGGYWGGAVQWELELTQFQSDVRHLTDELRKSIEE